jgi:hypothetical protein
MSQGIPCNVWVPDCDRKSHIGPGGSDDAKKIHRRRDADPEKGPKKYGRATFADTTNKKYPDTPSRIEAAWAYTYIHQPVNARQVQRRGGSDHQVRIPRAAKARKVALPDPDEFVELMARVRKKRK